MRSDQIEFFKSCAACLNFSLAAKYHFVSVSTLSRSISALEDELGLKLFERGYHGHRLTDAGRAFFEVSMNIGIEYEYFFRTWTKNDSDTLVIGCRPYNNCYARLLTAYSNASAEHPAVKIKVVIIPDDKLLQCLDDGIINVALANRNESNSSYFYVNFGNIDNNEYLFMSKEPLNEHEYSSLRILSSKNGKKEVRFT